MDSAYRTYDLDTHHLAELKLPANCWPSDWSPDGKRLLADLDDTGRVAWVDAEGIAEPELITRELEVAQGARLSPDGKRILCRARFRRPGEVRVQLRLSVIDLKTKRRAIVDDPGDTYGYCWSPHGSRIAYTWQRSVGKPQGEVLEIFLMTCNPDGTDRRVVTSRKLEVPVPQNGAIWGGTIVFFQVLDWR